MNQACFNQEYQRVDNCQTLKSKQNVEFRFGCFLLQKIYSFVPILYWLPRYNLKENLVNDVIAGVTCGIMAVPQGMAYASLAGVEPIYGLYSSFFAPFFYLFFGTSRHVAVGVFAVASMMVGNLIGNLITRETTLTTVADNSTIVSTFYASDMIPFPVTPMTIISALTFTVGIFQLLAGIFRLSFVTTYMSDQLVAGYTTGSAFHVFMSQVNKIIGVKTPHRSGFFMLPKMIFDIGAGLPKTNLITLAISIVGLVFLFITRELFNPWFARYSRIPIPFELILVIVMTVFSKLFNFNADLNISVVSHIPQGVPPPEFPEFRLIPYLWMDALTLAVICYMFLVSMAKLFAKKHKYKLDDNQELFALGFSSILSSFFPVYPAGGSLSRSSVCEMSGAKSQLYVLFTTLLLLVVILWLGPFLEALPMCILACIVIISLKGLFMQFKQLPRLWKVSKHDFIIWVVSCGTTIVTDPSFGLVASFTVVLLSIALREQWPKVRKLYTNKELDVFKDGTLYNGLSPIGNGIIVLKFESPLHFANCSRFKQKINDAMDDENFITVVVEKQEHDVVVDENLSSVIVKPVRNEKRLLIVDFSSVSYIDTMGAEAMCDSRKLAEEYNTELVFADIPETVLEILKLKEFTDFLPSNALFPTVRAALKEAGIERL
uniref:STAS domain-containing protein n=1 Tax=Panagrolaimus sp. JU765 TaxID=591449 RepID=A0AC34PUR6_9BILA